jgi:hypothetical protein
VVTAAATANSNSTTRGIDAPVCVPCARDYPNELPFAARAAARDDRKRARSA